MKPEFLKVKDNPDLVRARNSKAVLNTNQVELNKYKQIRDEKLKMRSLLERQETIESDMLEIKSLLKQLLERSGS
jgi:hypothetical protein